MDHQQIKELLYRASVLGSKGSIVVDYLEPQSATETIITFIIEDIESICDSASKIL
jgi:hypothetical protein